jgi:hypothetical protein
MNEAGARLAKTRVFVGVEKSRITQCDLKITFGVMAPPLQSQREG